MICTRTLICKTKKHLEDVILISTYIMRPVGVIKVETFHRVLSIRTLGVGNTCNILGQSDVFQTGRNLRVVAPSIWMIHSESRFISRLLKGLTLTATFTLDIYKRKDILEICFFLETELTCNSFLEIIRVLQWFLEWVYSMDIRKLF